MIESVGRRLRRAVEVRKPAWSVKSLQKSLKQRGVRGSSYGSMYNYLDGTSEPPLELLLACSEILGVSRAYLVEGLGEPTDAHEKAAAAIEAASTDLHDVLAPRLKRSVLRGLGLPDHLVRRGGDHVPGWVAPIAEVWIRLIEAGASDPEPIIATTLRAPLEAMGLDVEELYDHDRLSEYLFRSVPLLLDLTAEKRRQSHRLDAYVSGLPEDEEANVRREVDERKADQRRRAAVTHTPPPPQGAK